MIKQVGYDLYVEIVHPGGERKELLVEAIHQNFITVRWGQSGVYDIFTECFRKVPANTMIARNIAARRKGPCLWKAVDIESVRKAIYEHFHPKEKETLEEQYKRHHENMPGRAKPISSSK